VRAEVSSGAALEREALDEGLQPTERERALVPVDGLREVEAVVPSEVGLEGSPAAEDEPPEA
jgi:hypothetical protein